MSMAGLLLFDIRLTERNAMPMPKSKSDPVAVAAMDALSSSSSYDHSSSSEDDVPIAIKYKKRSGSRVPSSSSSSFPSSSSDDDYAPMRPPRHQKPRKHSGSRAPSSSPSPSSDDDDAPMRPSRNKKPRSATPEERHEGASDSGARKEPHHADLRYLKPCHEVGSAITAAWWPDSEARRVNKKSSWFPGVVRGITRVAALGPYGPTRYYDIEYDDGDEMHGLADHFLLSR